MRGRLEVNQLVLRTIVAESLKDYHEQFRMILSNPEMPVNAIGPELLELNRESLRLQLDMTKVVPPNEEEQKQIESRISERLGSRLSSLSATERHDEV